MKTNKFGKLQKLLLKATAEAGTSGCALSRLHVLAFPGNTYAFSYLVPVLLRMVHQNLLRVDWKIQRAFLKRGTK